MCARPSKKQLEQNDVPSKKTLFDHVKHIRQVQDPHYYVNLSDDDKKSFNVFMIIRALSMDEDIVEDMAELYVIFNKIPVPQFYKLLIALVPKSNRFYPWVKTRKLKHNADLLEYVSKRFNIPKYQANEYVNILILTKEGQEELVNICKIFGLEDVEIEKMFESRKYE